MKSSSWFFLFLVAAVLGIGAGYMATLAFRPTLLPPALRLGSLRQPTTVIFLGTDVVYTRERGRARADLSAFSGRSDTILVARLDPYRNSVSVLSIPRDTQVHIAGHGTQKINAANALGGPEMASAVVASFLGIDIDHYVILNVHGLVELVDELGGITVDIPKKMKYMDWTAKLKIDLEPGVHTLTGNQAMGFVRFRHDALGDIGRVQRQEIFLRALLDRALKPESWSRIPRLIEIGRQYLATDLSDAEIIQIAAFVKSVPKENQHLFMLPGRFSGGGDWLVGQSEIGEMVARLMGSSWAPSTKMQVRIAIENASSTRDLGKRLSKFLRAKGYEVVSIKDADVDSPARRGRTQIIAQRGNADDAEMVWTDLLNTGEIVNASIGDIESGITILAGDDLVPVVDGGRSGVRQSSEG